MAKFTMNDTTVSSDQTKNGSNAGIFDTNAGKKTQRHKPQKAADERIQAYSHNAYAALGPNYFIKKWLPIKGPAFFALVSVARSHIYWDYATATQRTDLFPSAQTLADECGIARTKVFELLADPHMDLFIHRKQRRRYDAASQKEVQTTNVYYVTMDDPPLPMELQRELEPGVADEDLDEVKVRRAQIRIWLLESGNDPDDPRIEKQLADIYSLALIRDLSEFRIRTLNAVRNPNSHSRSESERKDRVSIRKSLSRDTSISKSEVSESVARLAIGNGEQERKPSNNSTNQTMKQERSAEQADRMGKIEQEQNSEADQIETIERRKEIPQNRELGQVIKKSPILSENENWKAQARGWLNATRLPAHIGQAEGQTIIEHHMNQFGTENTAAAQEMILNHAAPILAKYHIPVETLEQLAEQARRRATMYVHKFDANGQPQTTNPGGYFLNVFKSVITEYGKTRDIGKLDRKTQKMETTDAAHDRAAQGLPARKATNKTNPTRPTLADAFNQQSKPEGWTGRSRASVRGQSW